jgi:hypothetical protein
VPVVPVKVADCALAPSMAPVAPSAIVTGGVEAVMGGGRVAQSGGRTGIPLLGDAAAAASKSLDASARVIVPNIGSVPGSLPMGPTPISSAWELKMLDAALVTASDPMPVLATSAGTFTLVDGGGLSGEVISAASPVTTNGAESSSISPSSRGSSVSLTAEEFWPVTSYTAGSPRSKSVTIDGALGNAALI